MSLQLKGNKLAFELLYERYFQKLVWYANQLVNNPEAAEDIVQEVFIKIIETPEKFDLNRTFSTWIYTITTNLSRNYNRNQKFRKDFSKQHIDDPEMRSSRLHHTLDAKLLTEQLKDIFSQLNEKEKSIYLLRFEQQLSIREIATIMNIPEGSVKSGIFYLLKKYSPLINYYSYEK